jgi:endonuclease/exonuclease/phosphatase family metal-dependent hydrolase
MKFRLLLILLCLCCLPWQETFAEGSWPLRVLTINVWSGSDYQGVWSFGDWESKATREQRYQVLLSQMRSIEPDVLFLQEANPVGQYASRLARALDMEEIHQVCIAGIKFGPVGIPAGFKEGNVILARRDLNLFKVDEWKLSGGPGIYSDAVTVHFDETISSLVGGIIVDSAVVYLVNNHLRAAPWADTAISDSLAVLQRTGHISPAEYQSVLKRWQAGLALRRTEVHRLLDKLRRLPAKSPVIVAGDFNALSSSPEIRDFCSQGKFHDTGQPDTSSQNVTWDPFHNTNTTFSYHTADARGHDLDLWNRLGSLGSSRAGRIDYVFLTGC